MTTMTEKMKKPGPMNPFNTQKWVIMTFFSIAITLYAAVVFISLTGILPTLLPEPLRASFDIRPVAFYVHIGFGAVALGTGAVNMNQNFLRSYRRLHRNVGKLYVVSVWLSAISGFNMAFYSAIGWIDHIGFAVLAILWFGTTTQAYLLIRDKQVVKHREWMLRSFSLTFAAVMLRLWMPILTIIGIITDVSDPFAFAYPIVSFLCWIPNLLFAEWWIRRTRRKGINKIVADLL